MMQLGMAILVVGFFMTVCGFMFGNSKILKPGLILTLSSMFIAVGASPSRGAPNGSPMMVLIGFFGVAAAIAMLYSNRKGNAVRKMGQRSPWGFVCVLILIPVAMLISGTTLNSLFAILLLECVVYAAYKVWMSKFGAINTTTDNLNSTVEEKNRNLYLEAKAFGINDISTEEGSTKLKEFISSKNYSESYDECVKMFKEGQEEQRKFMAKTLYSKCSEAGITNVGSVANVERIKLLLRNQTIDIKGIDEDEIVELFKIGRSEVIAERIKEQEIEKQKKVQQQKLEEQKREEEQRQYMYLYGRDKTIKMCQDKASSYRQREQELETMFHDMIQASSRAYNSNKERESSWGMHGGIASAIAGPAAGVMAAAEIQRNNAAKNERNKQLASSIAQITATGLHNIQEEKRRVVEQAEWWEKKAERAKNLLVSDLPEQDLLERMKPLVLSMNALETGSIEFKVRVFPMSNTAKLVIFDSVDAVIDGTLKVTFYRGEQQVGATYLTFPYDGAQERGVLEGICTSPKEKVPTEALTARFEPYRLWAIEKL